MYFSRMNWKLALWLAVMVAMTLACLPSGTSANLPVGGALGGIEPHDIYRCIELAMTSEGVEAGIMMRESAYMPESVTYQYIFWAEHGDEMRMAYSNYIVGESGANLDIQIDGVVVKQNVGSNWLKELGTRGFYAVTADQVAEYYHLFKAYSSTIVSQTTQIWPTVVIVPAALFQENYIDQKLAPMDT